MVCIVILSEAKNLISQFIKKSEILRRYAPQNDRTGIFEMTSNKIQRGLLIFCAVVA